MPFAHENRPLTSIRGFAAFWVVLHHLVPAALSASIVFRLGYRAVDLFFTLSGIIICAVYRDFRWRDLGRFWLKRVCRIYPLHVVALSALILIVIWPRWDVWPQLVTWRVAGSYALLQAFIDLRTAANPPAWSAGVELVCYLAFPPAILALRKPLPLSAILALTLAAAVAEYWTVATYLGDAFGPGAVLRGICGFGLGMALWRLFQRVCAYAALATAAEVIGLAGMALTVAFNWPAIIPLFSALLLFGLLFDHGPLARALRHEWCVWLGRISFSLYLMHIPLMDAADRVFPAASGATTWVRVAVLSVCLLVVSTLTYLLIEQPARRIPSLIIGRPHRPNAIGLMDAAESGG